MKLFIIAALVAIASAARLEHLERGYLPPDQTSQGRFGSQSVFGSPGPARFSTGSFGSGSQGVGHSGFGSSFESNAIETPAVRTGFGSSAFPGATINQYLPPDHGPSGANQFSGSLQGFGNQRSQYTPQSSFGGAASQPLSQYGAPSRYQASQFGSQGLQGPNQFGSQGLQGPSQFGSQGSSQFPATSRQYLAPQSNYPQQPFDEETGYHY